MYDWEQGDVPLDDVNAPLTARLLEIARGAIGKGRARMRLSREVALRSGDFDLQSFLSLLLCYRADTQADPNPQISLIDKSSAVREDSDAWCACRGHEFLLWGGGAFSKAAARPGKLSTNGSLIRQSRYGRLQQQFSV